MSKWKTMLESLKGIDQYAKSVGQYAKGVGKHAEKLGKQAFKTTKSTAWTIGGSYVGWKFLTTDKSVARIASEAVIGKEATDMVASVPKAINAPESSSVENEDGQAWNKLSPMDNAGTDEGKGLLDGLFGNDSGGTIGNFVSNLLSGNIKGMDMVGLIGAALLIFGRFGWFGKMAGALLGMLVMNNNSGHGRGAGRETTQMNAGELPYTRASVYPMRGDAERVFVKAWDKNGRECAAIGMSREEYDFFSENGYSPIQIYHCLSQMRQTEANHANGLTR